ncbi:MAG: hypothetical protein AAF801_15555 [Pseudomonadota bacterium]
MKRKCPPSLTIRPLLMFSCPADTDHYGTLTKKRQDFMWDGLTRKLSRPQIHTALVRGKVRNGFPRTDGADPAYRLCDV